MDDFEDDWALLRGPAPLTYLVFTLKGVSVSEKIVVSNPPNYTYIPTKQVELDGIDIYLDNIFVRSVGLRHYRLIPGDTFAVSGLIQAKDFF
jgi:hypothetical protein